MRRISIIIISLLFVFTSCRQTEEQTPRGSGYSRTTGWSMSEMELYGFDDPNYIEQETGPGLRLVQGGTFTMGRVDEDVMMDWDNIPRRVTVASFYIDETEVTNFDYRQYLSWISTVYPDDIEKYHNALPDTLVWRKSLAYNEPWVNNYLRHPAYHDYPVVGVNWLQAVEYCQWRTDRVNEKRLIQKGYIQLDSIQRGSDVFTTKGYLTNFYDATLTEDSLRARWEDGVMFPNYRLPTEAEWEYAALGLIGEADGELLTQRRMYPWSGQYLREANKAGKGTLKANFVRGGGDYMGMAGALNDEADITAPVFSYEPNDYGLYNMVGNVNEWVADVYRPLSPQDIEEFQPYRGNVITQYRTDSDGEIIFNEYGDPVKDTILDLRNAGDGDYTTVHSSSGNWNSIRTDSLTTAKVYLQEETEGVINSTITDKVRVYKGGSWQDRAYWLNPGSRRYLDEREAAADIGFRCAMTRLGSPTGK